MYIFYLSISNNNQGIGYFYQLAAACFGLLLFIIINIIQLELIQK